MDERRDISIPLGDVVLEATLETPVSPTGFVIFAPRSRGDCRDPWIARVASLLVQRGFSALVLDLLTPEELRDEAADPTVGPDVEVLAVRLIGVLDRARESDLSRGCPIALFGSGSCAAAALIAAARRNDMVSAVIGCGGQPGLAGPWLPLVRTPTLLIIGSRDLPLARANRDAARNMIASHYVAAIPGATNRFAEPGALDEVAGTTAKWLLDESDRQSRARTTSTLRSA